MQHIQIIAVGSLREKAYATACAEYCKRLGAFCRLSVTEVAEFRLPKNPGDAQIQAGIQAEGEAILQKIAPKAFVAGLCIEGDSLSSRAFAGKLAGLGQSHPAVAFVIGGSHGLSSKVKQACGLRLSMSEMTFPHQLARVMLLEQIYRAFSISSGGKYHK